jgi:hypothetical protein
MFIPILLATFGCCFYGIPFGYSNGYIPPPSPFNETVLVGTWQAKYGSTNIDTITLKADGAYQQVFQAPEINYYYESPWNEWHVEYSQSGKPKLHLEGMRFYAAGVEIGESEGKFPTSIRFNQDIKNCIIEI